MTGRVKAILVGVFIASAALMAFRYLSQRALVSGDTWTEALSGAWEMEYHRSVLSHGGSAGRLLRRRDMTVVVVDVLVAAAHYVGDDCVVYASYRDENGRQFLAVCGDLLPVALTPPTYAEWHFEQEGLVRHPSLGDKRKLELLSLAEIKNRASDQPEFRDTWYRAATGP